MLLDKLDVQRILLNQRLSELDSHEVQLEKDMLELQKKEKDLVKRANDKYELSSLDPETGVLLLLQLQNVEKSK